MSDLASDSPADRSSPPKAGQSGWRVDPAPDGRGAPPESKPPMIPRSRTFIAFLLGLLVLNIVISVITGSSEDRPRVP